MVQLSHPFMITGKTTALTMWTFVSKVMSLLFNMLFRFVILFLPRNKCLWISWLQSPSAVILSPTKIKSVTVSIVSPAILPWSDGTRCHDLSFLNVEFWARFITLLFHLHQETLSLDVKSSFSLSAIRVVSSAYLRLLIFLLVIRNPVCDSSSSAFCMMYSACKLNKQGDSIQPWHTPFSIWNQSVVPCSVLTVASWPAYRFLRSQVRYSHLFKNFLRFEKEISQILKNLRSAIPQCKMFMVLKK